VDENSTACRWWLPAGPAALGDQFTTAPATESSDEYNLYLKQAECPGARTIECFDNIRCLLRFYDFANHPRPYTTKDRKRNCWFDHR
jgi:hypothetical protein